MSLEKRLSELFCERAAGHADEIRWLVCREIEGRCDVNPDPGAGFLTYGFELRKRMAKKGGVHGT